MFLCLAYFYVQTNKFEMCGRENTYVEVWLYGFVAGCLVKKFPEITAGDVI